MTVKERLIYFLKTTNIKQKEFNEKINVSKGYIGAISQSPSNTILNRITKHFPDLNIEWLLTGNGKMLNHDSVGENKSNLVNEPLADYGTDSILIPREVFEMMNKLTDTVQSQQRTIENLQRKLSSI